MKQTTQEHRKYTLEQMRAEVEAFTNGRYAEAHSGGLAQFKMPYNRFNEFAVCANITSGKEEAYIWFLTHTALDGNWLPLSPKTNGVYLKWGFDFDVFKSDLQKQRYQEQEAPELLPGAAQAG